MQPRFAIEEEEDIDMDSIEQEKRYDYEEEDFEESEDLIGDEEDEVEELDNRRPAVAVTGNRNRLVKVHTMVLCMLHAP